jgi:hypothetical protein
MSIFAIAIIAALAASLTIILVKLMMALNGNVKTAESVRTDVLRQVDDLRYGDMLEKRGIDKLRYVHKVGLVEVAQEMKRCHGCEKMNTCDNALAQNQSEQALIFCPNNDSITQHQAVA